MDTLFVPLIHPARAAAYAPGDFALATTGDAALEVTFTPAEREDLDVHLPAPAIVFFLPGGQETALPGGPTVTPGADAIAFQILNLDAIVAEARAAANPPPVFAPWWIVEGVERNDFLQFVRSDRDEEDRQAAAKGYDLGDFRDALRAGETSFNVAYRDASGLLLRDPLAVTTLSGQPGAPATIRIATYYGWDLPPAQYSTMDVSSSLATVGLLNPAAADHPLVARASSAVQAGDLALHVAFQYWNPLDPQPPGIGAEGNKGGFARMPAGTVVRLMRVNAADPHLREEVAAGALDASGTLQFDPAAPVPQALPRAALALNAGEVLAFQVESPDTFVTQYQRDGTPRAPRSRLDYRTGGGSQEIWLTFGLSSTTGEPGSLPALDAYPAASFGLPSAPIVYNVGIPVFLQIEYVRLLANAGVYDSRYERAPKGVLVTVTNSSEWDLGEFYTDEHGQILGSITRWDPGHPDIRVLVKYRMEDRPPAGGFYPLGLPRVDGVVQAADTPTAAREEEFDSSWINPKAARGARPTFGFAGRFSDAGLGAPPGAGAGLEVVRVGAIDVGWKAPGDSRYDSGYEPVTGLRLFGEHGGLLDAFKTLRHAHEWWHQLTASSAGATADPGLQRTWRDLFDPLHRAGIADPGLLVRVIPDADVRIRGGAAVVPNTDRFELKLLHPGRWNRQRLNPDNEALAPEALALLWSRGTIHHEFAHVVLLVATAMNGANAAALAAGQAVYNAAYDPLQVEASTFTPLLEGVSNFVTLGVGASNGTFLGARFAVDAAGTAVVANLPNQAPAGLLISAGKARADGQIDPRLGLFVPGAVARAFWDFLSRSNPALAVIPDPAHPDLKDDLPAIANPDVQRMFQRVAWLPMLALATRDSAAGWDDFDNATAPYPTTFSLIQHLATHPDCYAALQPVDRQSARDTFGTAQPAAWYLWDAWPP